jgi:polyisoprenyl-phosphate glycosyltransferase
MADHSSGEADGSVVILIPLFNDWASFSELVDRLDVVLVEHGLRADVLIVDDGSTIGPSADQFVHRRLGAVRRVDVLGLRRNLGHQRAIAVGLAYVESRLACDAVVVMDGDGEDAPEDVPRLLARLSEEGGRPIVFAERTRRSESWSFHVFYALYNLLHVLLIGQRVRVGNFSVVPRRRLTSLVAVSELWNHYAASVVQSRQPWCTIPTRRAKRLRGKSAMNFVALVTHGLSAISVYSDIVGVRLLVVATAMAGFALVGLCVAVFTRLATNLAVPGWATYTAGLLLVLLLQSVLLAATFSFVILSGRHGSAFLPVRDYGYYVGEVRTLHKPADAATPESIHDRP